MSRFLIIIFAIIGVFSIIAFFYGYGMIKQARLAEEKKANEAEMEAAYFYNENINV